MTADDALQFIIAGATAVAVGTGNFVDPSAALNVRDGIEAYCRRHGIQDVVDLVGSIGMEKGG